MRATVAAGLALLLSTAGARADSLVVGGGSGYYQFHLPHAGETVDSVYRGPGINLELRLRLNPYGSDGPVAFDLGGAIERVFAQNVGAGLDEPYSLLGYGGVLDARFGWLFVGVHYSKTTTKLVTRSTSTTTTFQHTPVGFRAGINLGLSSRMNMHLAGTYLAGNAILSNGSSSYYQPVQQFSFHFLVHYNLLNTGGPGDY